MRCPQPTVNRHADQASRHSIDHHTAPLQRASVPRAGQRVDEGSKRAIENDAAEISGASAHAREAGAAFAVVVAREFKGFRAGATDAMVLKECREQATPVSVQAMSGGLLELYENVHAVNLLQHPAVVAEFIAANVGAR